MEPKEGLLTFRAEGNNIPGSQYYSRKIHWPGNPSISDRYGSGLTIGRGYNMKERPESTIISDMVAAGISLENARKIAKGSKKSFCTASEL